MGAGSIYPELIDMFLQSIPQGDEKEVALNVAEVTMFAIQWGQGSTIDHLPGAYQIETRCWETSLDIKIHYNKN